MKPVASSALLSSFTGFDLRAELGGRMGLPAGRGERLVGEVAAIDSARSRAFSNISFMRVLDEEYLPMLNPMLEDRAGVLF
jgi:hypothetical protein